MQGIDKRIDEGLARKQCARFGEMPGRMYAVVGYEKTGFWGTVTSSWT